MKSKLSDFSCLARDDKLCPHIPVTRPYSQYWLEKMLENHAILYIKPDNSLKGIGIIRIDKDEDKYTMRVQDTKKTLTFDDPSAIWEATNRAKRKQTYMIQQGIASLTNTGKPFDVRVHLLRVDGTWHVGGMIGKVAPKENIVTNGSAGAHPSLINNLLETHLGCTAQAATELKSQLKEVCINAAKAMKIKRPKWCEYGLDIGIDRSRNVWIYEMNTMPAPTGFKEIDRSSYLRILSLRKRAS